MLNISSFLDSYVCMYVVIVVVFFFAMATSEN
jgi:hypothetical protein